MAKLTNPDDEYDFMQKGKTIQRLEYGIVYPDGTVDWMRDPSGPRSFATPEGREEFLKSWREQVERLKLTTTQEPRFLKRIRKITFSEPEHLPS